MISLWLIIVDINSPQQSSYNGPYLKKNGAKFGQEYLRRYQIDELGCDALHRQSPEVQELVARHRWRVVRLKDSSVFLGHLGFLVFFYWYFGYMTHDFGGLQKKVADHFYHEPVASLGVDHHLLETCARSMFLPSSKWLFLVWKFATLPQMMLRSTIKLLGSNCEDILYFVNWLVMACHQKLSANGSFFRLKKPAVSLRIEVLERGLEGAPTAAIRKMVASTKPHIEFCPRSYTCR